jgi:hypothetical protein
MFILKCLQCQLESIRSGWRPSKDISSERICWVSNSSSASDAFRWRVFGEENGGSSVFFTMKMGNMKHFSSWGLIWLKNGTWTMKMRRYNQQFLSGDGMGGIPPSIPVSALNPWATRDSPNRFMVSWWFYFQCSSLYPSQPSYECKS